MEIWKDIKGYEGMYQASNLGQIKSLKLKKEKILKQCKNEHGYLVVNLCKNGKWKTCRVHRLIADTFIPNPENKPCVNHINGQKDDNNIKNLEFCTYSENMFHAYKNNLNNAKTPTRRMSALINLAKGRKVRREKYECKSRNSFEAP